MVNHTLEMTHHQPTDQPASQPTRRTDFEHSRALLLLSNHNQDDHSETQKEDHLLWGLFNLRVDFEHCSFLFVCWEQFELNAVCFRTQKLFLSFLLDKCSLGLDKPREVHLFEVNSLKSFVHEHVHVQCEECETLKCLPEPHHWMAVELDP